MKRISFCSIRLLAMSLMIGVILVLAPKPASARVSVGVFVSFAPPELPVYAQPVCPGDGYIWTPGYWAWDPDVGDYYWVPGTWVFPPEPGLLWTPGYWGWGPDGYFFTAGYWGPVVGFYGGIDYGFGYYGHDYYGGRWEHGHFFYNRDVSNINVTIVHNVYNERVFQENHDVSRVSFNGGRGGVYARPTSRELAAARERHFPRDAAQISHREHARADRQLRASVNHGAPPIAATPRAGEFHGHGVVRTRIAGAVHTPHGNRQNFSAGRGGHAHHMNSEGRARYMQAAHRPERERNINPRENFGHRQRHEQQRPQMQRQRQSRAFRQRSDRPRQQFERRQSNSPGRRNFQPRFQRHGQRAPQRHAEQRRAPRPSQQRGREQGHPHGRPH